MADHSVDLGFSGLGIAFAILFAGICGVGSGLDNVASAIRENTEQCACSQQPEETEESTP